MSTKRSLNKPVLFLIIALVAVIVILGCFLLNSNKKSSASEQDTSLSISDTVKIQKEQGDLFSKSDDDILYAFYAAKKQYAKVSGTSKSEKQIKEDLARTAALCWYARKHDMIPSDKDMEKYMDELVLNVKESEEYPEYEQAAEDLGTTYEKILCSNLNAYRVTQTIENVYVAFTEPYETNEQMTVDEQEEHDQKVQKAWEAYQDKIEAKYKRSAGYKQFCTDFAACQKKYQSEA